MSLETNITQKFLHNEPLSRHTTWRVGGPAKFYVEVEHLYELQESLRFCQDFNYPYFILGNGSNLLVSDKGFNGLVIKLEGDFKKVKREGERIVAGAGVSLPRLAHFTCQEGLEGLAFAVGIPGTLGGALLVNAGAFGRNIGEVIEKTKVLLSKPQLEVKIIEKKEILFEYRESSLSSGVIVLEAVLKLRVGEPAEIKKKIREYKRRRAATQPLDNFSAGSVFKNPPGHPAAYLIEKAGCKNWRVGDAMVAEKHANFIINRGKATATDIYTLMRKIQQRVADEFGLWLEPEVKLVGEFE